MAGGGGGGTLWIKVLIGGAVLVAVAMGLEHQHTGPTWLLAALLATGGLGVVFGSCEAMILCVQGVAQRAGWNPFVAGTMGGLASNIPEMVMLGFVLAKAPRVGFIVVALTLHVGALAFGVYSGLLPRDASGHAKLPEPLVKLSTDLYACAGGVFLTMGALMTSLQAFSSDAAITHSFSATDLYVIAGFLLLVEIVAVLRLVKRFSGTTDGATTPPASNDEAVDPPASVSKIVLYGVVGLVTSVIGGHAVGDFAEILVHYLRGAGYSEMIGALLLSIFACAGAYVMIATAHVKGMYDIALANVSGAVTQVPFVVLPITLILLGAFNQSGITPPLPNGGALSIDLETTSVLLLGFPPMLILWKAVQDDGAVNWLETVSMVSIFGLSHYFLASQG